jgi:uncharacterized membrane protein
MDERLDYSFWELDFFRGVAIVMMVIYHLLFDLSYFGGYSIYAHSGFWRHFAQATAAIFILLVGISLTLSASKAQILGIDKSLFNHFLKRGLKIFLLGMAITLVTYYLIGRGFIVFGILHFIGLAIILAYPFLKLRIVNIFIGFIFILIGLYLQSTSLNLPELFWVGLTSKNFYTLDYFPLFPWFGIVLIGIFLGNSLYPEYRRRIDLPDLSGSLWIRPFNALGRRSLLIYLIHQPAMIIILSLAGIIHFPWAV